VFFVIFVTGLNGIAVAQSVTITPSKAHLRPKDERQFKATLKDMPFKCAWDTDPKGQQIGLIIQPAQPDQNQLTDSILVKAPDAVGEVAYVGPVALTCAASDMKQKATIVLINDKTEPEEAADITTAIVGFEQAGASSADSDQQFFFDFFLSRPLPVLKGKPGKTFGPPLRWWGDVRIASYPQQVNAPISEFVQNLGGNVGNLKVNEVAKFGEFRSGIEVRLTSFDKAFPFSGGEQKSTLSLISYFGALGAFHPPTGAAVFASSSANSLIQNLVQVFNIPAGAYNENDPNRTPQAAAFSARYPAKKYPSLTLPGTKYVAFTAPDRDQFYRQYGLGFRLTTRFYDENRNLLPSAAMVSASFGQHELVSGSQLRGVVGRFEGFYPYRIRSTGVEFYLFGRANLKFGAVSQRQPIVLQLAKDSSGNAIPITDPGIAIIAEPSRRDLYTIGFGVDLSSAVNKWLNHNSN
jgi:hypothetical protein